MVLPIADMIYILSTARARPGGAKTYAHAYSNAGTSQQQRDNEQCFPKCFPPWESQWTVARNLKRTSLTNPTTSNYS
eukprot:50247-Pyramimonas_sp.AAC.1